MNIDIIEKLFPKEAGKLKHRKCPTCGADMRNPVFKDKLSEKEFFISGMCQKCQDEVFGGEDD